MPKYHDSDQINIFSLFGPALYGLKELTMYHYTYIYPKEEKDLNIFIFLQKAAKMNIIALCYYCDWFKLKTLYTMP